MKTLTISLFALSLFSCSQYLDKPKKPEVFLEQKEMEKLLVEIHISDAIAQEKAHGNLDLEKNLAEQGLSQILQNHHMKKAAFDSLYKYYLKQPDVMNAMYQNIITDLSRKQAQLTH